MVTPLAFFGLPGQYEMIILLVVMMLLFGHRLPGVMRSLGRGVVEFKKGVKGIEDDLNGAEDETDRHVEKTSQEG